MYRYLILLACLVPHWLAAQSELLVRSTPSGAELRWTPSDTETWLNGLRHGWIVERASSGSPFVPLTNVPVLPAVLRDGVARNAADSLLLRLRNRTDGFDLGRVPKSAMAKLEMARKYYTFLVLESPEAMQRSGLYFFDSGGTGRYRVRVASPKGSLSVVGEDVKAPAAAPLSARVRDRFATLAWMHRYQNPYFTQYRLERGITPDATQELGREAILPPPVNAADGLGEVGWTDSLPSMTEAYYYRLVAIGPFADRHLSEPLQVRFRDVQPPPLPAAVALAAEGRTLQLTWTYEAPPEDLTGFAVWRSTAFDTLFRQVGPQLPPGTRSFNDTPPADWQQAHYRVVALDRHGNEAAAVPVSHVFVDKTPPAQPQGLRAAIDAKGEVQLAWTANDEPDLLGYRVEGGWASDAEFVPLTQNFLLATSLTDTLALNVLRRAYYYRVCASDRDNNVSSYSPPVRVVLPDTVPPLTPQLQLVTPRSGEEVQLSWQTWAEDDLRSATLERRIASPDGDWSEVRSFSLPLPSAYTDRAAATIGYLYRLRTTDAQDNPSTWSDEVFAAAVVAASAKTSIQLSVTPIDTQRVQLSWSGPAGIYSVYRIGDDDLPELLEATEKTGYTDAGFVAGNRYFIVLDGDFATRSAIVAR